MADYTRQINRVRRQFERKGELCTWKRYDATQADVPWEEQGRDFSRDFQVWIAFGVAGQQTLYRSGTLVARGGYTGYMGAQTFEPSLKDRIVRGDEFLGIKDIIVYQVNEQPIAYQIAFNR